MHQYLLDNFGTLLSAASDLRTQESDDPISLKAAVTGFSLYHDLPQWGRDEFDYVSRFLTEDPKPVDLNRVPDGEEGFEAFLCLGLGALCGCYASGKITTREELGRQEWLLVAFMSAHNAEICQRYLDFAA